MPTATPKIVELLSDDDDDDDVVSSPIKRKTTTAITTIKKDKAKSSANNSSSSISSSASSITWSWFLFKWTLVTILFAFGAAQFIAGDLLWGYRGKYTKIQTYMPPPKRVFTPEELWEYNGTDEDKPVYLSILGKVFDVTPGRWVYGPRGSYHFFAGRDASRAYVTGCFETHLTHDLRGLSVEEVQQIAMWQTFFDEHPRYAHIGNLDLPTIDTTSPIPEPCNNKAESKDPAQVAS